MRENFSIFKEKYSEDQNLLKLFIGTPIPHQFSLLHQRFTVLLISTVELLQLVVQQKFNVFILIIGCIPLYRKREFQKELVYSNFSYIYNFSAYDLRDKCFADLFNYLPIDILERKKKLQKADQDGHRAIVVTCDDPTHRVRDHVLPLYKETSKTVDPKVFQSMATANMALTKLPISCKGILSPANAQLAIKYGANRIVVRFVSHIRSLV
jgi:hypothetical protein